MSVIDDQGNFTSDVMVHTGAMPHLIQYLWDEYRQYVEAQLTRIPEAKRPKLTDTLRKAPAVSFVEFSANFLLENRVSELFHLDAGAGVRLTNNVPVAICPMSDTGRGDIDHSGYVSITDMKRRGAGEVINDPSCGI